MRRTRPPTWRPRRCASTPGAPRAGTTSASPDCAPAIRLRRDARSSRRSRSIPASPAPTTTSRSSSGSIGSTTPRRRSGSDSTASARAWTPTVWSRRCRRSHRTSPRRRRSHEALDSDGAVRVPGLDRNRASGGAQGGPKARRDPCRGRREAALRRARGGEGDRARRGQDRQAEAGCEAGRDLSGAGRDRGRAAQAPGHPHRGRDSGSASAVHHRARAAPLHGFPAPTLSQDESGGGRAGGLPHPDRRGRPASHGCTKGEHSMNFLSNAATFYKEGGMFMHVVLVIAVLIIAIVFERLIVIGRAAALNGRKMTDDLVKAAARGDLAGAHKISMQSGAPLARVAQAMLQSGTTDEEALQITADDTATLVLPGLSKRLPHLGVLANSATLIGLLGTITGLITAISGVGVADAAQRSAYLSAGISEA